MFEAQPTQITVHQSKEGTYLLYVEDASKNHQGGLKGRKVSSKQVKNFENVENPYRCFVRLFQLYLSKLPQDCPKNMRFTSSHCKNIQPMEYGFRSNL